MTRIKIPPLFVIEAIFYAQRPLFLHLREHKQQKRRGQHLT